MKRIVIALLVLAMSMSLFVACAPKYSPVKGGEVSVCRRYVEPPMDPVSLEKGDAEQLIAYLQNLSDGKNHLCDCMADVSLVIGEQTFYYHSDSGVLTEEGDKTNIYYVGDNREAINEILKQYITLRP
ncbi:MAG: hypothetical protein IKW66_01920 [Clostridia bacterium]|nr:hypothetical protein [Clostridia bacterium]